MALGAAAAIQFAAGAAAASSGRPVTDRPSVVLSAPLPALVRGTEPVMVAGRVRHAPRDVRAALELAPGGRWHAVSRVKLSRGGAFTLHWRVGATLANGPVRLRVVALENGVLVAATAAAQAWVGPAPRYCAPPLAPRSVPPGDGWIVGGEYIEGGAFPGLDACESAPYTITARTAAGVLAASEAVAGGHSYTLVLPPGSYMLRGGCGFASARVLAGRRTVADALCLVP